jgi:hypothetical protein
MAELQTLAAPVPAQGLTLVRNVEDMEMYTRQKVARARMAVDTAMRLLAEELASGSYWMEIRKTQHAGRSFGIAPAAALQALRAVVPWQDDERPELPNGDLISSFMWANSASAFMGGNAAPPTVGAARVRLNAHARITRRQLRRTSAQQVRRRTRGSVKRVRARREMLRAQAGEPIGGRPKPRGRR